MPEGTQTSIGNLVFVSLWHANTLVATIEPVWSSVIEQLGYGNWSCLQMQSQSPNGSMFSAVLVSDRY